MGREAYGDRRNPEEDGDDRHEEWGVAPGHEQEDNEEPTSHQWNDRDRSPAGVAAHRESHRQRRQHTHRDDQQKRDAVHPAVPRDRATAAQHRGIDPECGQH